MTRRLFALFATALLPLATLSAQTPTPTPEASPTPTPEASPTPTPDASPSPTPIAADPDGPIPVEPFPAADATPTPDATPDVAAEDELGLPADFGDPGDPPPYVPNIEPNLNDVAPSPEQIRKMNDQAIAQINAFAQSQRNPNVPDLSLDDSIQTALKQNPDILNAIQQIRLTRGQVIEVRAAALPQLAVTAAYNQQQRTLVDPKQPDRGGSAVPATLTLPDGQQATLDFGSSSSIDIYTNDKSYNIQLQASQLIYNGGGTLAGIRAAKFVEDSAYFSLRQTIDQTISSVKTAFHQVILNRALVVAQQQSVNLLQEQLTDQQNRFEAGTIPRFNVLQAEVALSNAKPPLIQALNDLRISQYQLVVLLGMDYSTASPSVVPFNVAGSLPYQPRAINADESIRVAIERSPLLKSQRRNILAQAQNVKVAFSGYLPVISATGGYIVQNNTAFQSLGELTQGWTAGIQGSWAIFDGFETAGQTAQARAALEQAAIAYDNSVRQIILDVQQAISNLQTASETLESQQQNVVQGTEALRLSQERLDAGAGTQLDVLNAQVALLQAQTTVLQARYDYIAALAQYDLALSLDAQYSELFDDPLATKERESFERITNPTAPQPPLPEQYQEGDPIKGLAANAPGAPAVEPTPTPEPQPTATPSKRTGGGRAFVPGRR